MDIQTVHDQILLRLNKDQTSYLSHEDIDKALDVAQIVYFNTLFGNPATYQPGRSVGTPSYGQTQKIHDDLLPFKKVIRFSPENISAVNYFGTGPNGVGVLPSDYLHMIALYRGSTPNYVTIATHGFEAATQSIETNILQGYTVKLSLTNQDGDAYDGSIDILYDGNVNFASPNSSSLIFTAPSSNGTLEITSDIAGQVVISIIPVPVDWKMVEFLSEDQWADRIDSSLLTPVATKPIAKMLGEIGYVESVDELNNDVAVPFAGRSMIQMFPRQGYTMECVYLKRPAAPQFVYTLSGRTVIYDASASTQLEWNDQAIIRIIDEALNVLSQYTADRPLEQHTEIKRQQPR